MKTLNIMLLKSFITVFIVSMLFFILVLELVDLFSNLWRYLNFSVKISDIFTVAILYIPKCISYSLPLSILFATSFTLGNFYSNNELLAILGSGVSLYQFVRPVIIFSLLISVSSFVFEENIVISSFEKKNSLKRQLLNQSSSESRSNVTVIDSYNNIIYHAKYYNNKTRSLNNLIIIDKDENQNLDKRIDAEWAEWGNDRWILKRASILARNKDSSYSRNYKEVYSDPGYNQKPDFFKKTVQKIEELKRKEAKNHIHNLKKSGIPYKGVLTEYYKRYSFALTPLIVCLLSTPIGGRFKKNILLMSLLASLCISVLYYVFQMLTVLFAKYGYIPPLMGAWSPFMFFMGLSIVAHKYART